MGKETRKYCYIVGVLLAHVVMMMAAYVSVDYSMTRKIEFFGYVSNFVFTVAMIQLVMEFMEYRKERIKKQNE